MRKPAGGGLGGRLGAGIVRLARRQDRRRRRRRLVAGHQKRIGSHASDTRRPAGAELGPRPERAEVKKPPVGERVDEIRRGSSRRGVPGHWPDLAVGRDAQALLQHLGCFPRPGVHGEVEQGVVDADREIVAADRRPIAPVIDLASFVGRELPYIVDSDGAAAVVAERCDGDPVFRRSAGIPGIVDVAALAGEDERKRTVEIRCRHVCLE
jgi:hypothetical protein